MRRSKHPLRDWWGLLFLFIVLAGVGCKKPIPPYLRDIQQLRKKTHPDTRIDPIQRLGHYSSKAAEIAPVLAKELRSPSHKVRAAAIRSLYQLGPHTAVLLAMMQALSSHDKHVRRFALENLKRWERDSQYALQQGLVHPKATVRRGAVDLIYATKSHYKRQHHKLIKLWQDPDPHVRSTALATTLRWHTPSQPLLREVAKSWGALSPESKQKLGSQLKHQISRVMYYAIPLLDPKQAKAQERLGIAQMLRYLSQPKPLTNARPKKRRVRPAQPVQRRVGRIKRMGTTQFRQRNIYPPWHPRGQLKPRRKGKVLRARKPQELRWFAPQDIARGASGIVLSQLSRAWPALCQAAAQDKERKIRRTALETSQALYQRGQRAPCFTDALATAIFDKDPGIKRSARAMLLPQKETTTGLLAATLKLLRNKTLSEQRLGLRLLRRFGTQGAAAIPILARWLQPDNPDMAALAAEAMGRLGPRAFPPLRKAWQRKDLPASLRMSVLEALTHVGARHPAYATTMQDAIRSKDPILQVYGTLGMRHLSPKLPWWHDQLRKLLASANQALRNAALQTITHKGKAALALLPDVLPLLSASQRDTWRGALRAAASMACTQPKVLAAIQQGLRSHHPDERRALAKALRDCPYKTKRAIEPLRHMHVSAQWQDRRAAIQAYSRLDALAVWRKGLKDPHPQVRAAASKALQSFQDCPKALFAVMARQLQSAVSSIEELDRKYNRRDHLRQRIKRRIKRIEARLKRPSMQKLRKRSPGLWYRAAQQKKNALRRLRRMLRRPRWTPPEVRRWLQQEKTLLRTLGTLLGGCDAPAWPLLHKHAWKLSKDFRRSIQGRWQQRFASYLKSRQTSAGQIFGQALVAQATKAAAQAKKGTPNTLWTTRFLVTLYRPYPGLLPPLLRDSDAAVRRLALRLWGSWLLAHHPLPMRRRKQAYLKQGLRHRRAVPRHVTPLSPDQRKAALQTLGWALQDKEGSIRLHAFRLWRSITTKRQWLQKAGTLLKDPTAAVRHEALRLMLKHAKTGRMWKLALRMARDPDAPIRFDAVQYALKVVPRTKRLPILLRAAADRSPALRQIAAREFEVYAKADKRAKAALRKLLGDRNYSVKHAAQLVWGRLFPYDSKAYTETLVKLLSKNRYRRRRALMALRRRYRKWMPKTAEWLGGQLKVKDPTRRIQALLAIRGLYTRHAVPYVKQALKDKDPRVVRVARMVLSRYGPLVGAAELPALCARIEKARDPGTQVQLLQELRHVIRYNWKPALGTIRRLLHSPSPKVRVAALQTLAPLGTRGIGLGLMMRKDKSPEVRIAAARLLGQMGLFARRHIQPLLKDPDPRVRQAAKGAFRMRRR